MTRKPILDPAPTGRALDWTLNKIQMLKGVETLVFPPRWENELAKHISPRDQDDRGTCVGQATAYLFDILHLKLLGRLPTEEEKAQFKKDVTDELGTIHDVLYTSSASAECFYQISRYIGKVTYPAGSEIRYAVRAWKDYGAVPETVWHTDKKGLKVWDYPPGSRATSDGGISPEDAAIEAINHTIEGYAMCGRSDGYATLDQIRYAIFTKGVVLAAIPVYDNYGEMQGGDGTFPTNTGRSIVGYHALCIYGYDEDNLYCLHSWGDWCGRFGKISRSYFNNAIDQSVWMVVLDSSDVEFGKKAHSTLEVTSNVPASLTVDGTFIGMLPQKIAVEKGKTYAVAVAADGYIAHYRMVDDSTSSPLNIVLDPAPVVETWWQKLYNLIKRLFGWT